MRARAGLFVQKILGSIQIDTGTM